MCWPLEVSKLDFIASLMTAYVQGKLHFEELVTLMPLNLRGRDSGKGEVEGGKRSYSSLQFIE